MFPPAVALRRFGVAGDDLAEALTIAAAVVVRHSDVDYVRSRENEAHISVVRCEEGEHSMGTLRRIRVDAVVEVRRRGTKAPGERQVV